MTAKKNQMMEVYMMEVEDDTVHGSVTTEVSGPEGESEDDEWVVKPHKDEPLADGDWVANYYKERCLKVQKLENATVSPRWTCYFGKKVSLCL